MSDDQAKNQAGNQPATTDQPVSGEQSEASQSTPDNESKPNQSPKPDPDPKPSDEQKSPDQHESDQHESTDQHEAPREPAPEKDHTPEKKPNPKDSKPPEDLGKKLEKLEAKLEQQLEVNRELGTLLKEQFDLLMPLQQSVLALEKTLASSPASKKKYEKFLQVVKDDGEGLPDVHWNSRVLGMLGRLQRSGKV